MKAHSIVRTLVCAVLSLSAIAPAIAGPDRTTYVPITTMKQAESIKPGTRLAVECGVCGAVKTMVADKDKSYLHGVTCDRCKLRFVVQTDPHGGVRGGSYVCTDSAGHKAKLLAEM